MSVVHTFSESMTAAEITAWAFAHPAVPRVIGIDVGQDKLAVWFGAPNPDALATDVASMRFVYFSWLLCRCSATATNKQACDLVVGVLSSFANTPFGLASDVVIEKQHKKNGRMKAIAAAIRKWVLSAVPNAAHMRVSSRQALSKFATIVQMPCPMPREYAVRKKASERVVDAQVRNWAGPRWFHFYQRHSTCADDLADAALIAQDYTITTYPTLVVAPSALASVYQIIARRKSRNTWRKTKTPRPARSEFVRKFSEYFDDDDDADEHDEKRSNSTDHGGDRRTRRRQDTSAEYQDIESVLPLYTQMMQRYAQQ